MRESTSNEITDIRSKLSGIKNELANINYEISKIKDTMPESKKKKGYNSDKDIKCKLDELEKVTARVNALEKCVWSN